MSHPLARIAQLSDSQRELLAHRLGLPACTFNQAYQLVGREQLVAHVAQKPGQALSNDALRTFLKRLLPDYMLPETIGIQDELPRLPNGKIDRTRLAQIAADLNQGTHIASGAKTPTEQRLTHIWNTIFERQGFNQEDDFFALGGNSLLATRLCAQIERAFDQKISVRELFDHPKPALLASYIDARQRRIPNAPAGDTDQDHRPASANPKYTPLSFQQRRLWFLEQWHADSTGSLSSTYNMAAKLSFCGQLDRNRLASAFEALVMRHQMLRARFTTDQVGSPRFCIDVVGAKLTPHLVPPDADQEQWVRQFIWDRVNKPFDLQQGPPIRADLIEQGTDQAVLLITMHHIVSDGWSFGILLRELIQGYREWPVDEAAEQDPTEQSCQTYWDYVAWQEQHLNPNALQPHMEYWKRKLKDMPQLLELPTDSPRPLVRSHRGGVVKCHLEDPLRRHVERFAQANAATPFMVMLTVFKVILARYTEHTDIVVGTATANRQQTAFENTIGFFADTLVLRTQLHQKDDFLNALDKVRQTVLDAHAHQDVPFEVLVKTLNPDRHLSHSPLFQVVFTMLPPLTRRVTLPNLEITTEDVYNATAKFDLIFALEEQEQGLNAELEYNTDLFESESIQRLFSNFSTLLKRVLDAPHKPVLKVPILTGADQQTWLMGCKSPSDIQFVHKMPPLDGTVIDWFEAQARAHPSRPALGHDGAAMTYEELNQRTNQIAHVLLAEGIGKGHLVGIYLPRTFDMVAAVIAILKAGAAYVPLDHNYPADRLAYMLEDAGLSLLVTQANSGAERLAFPGKTLLLQQVSGQATSDYRNPQQRVTNDHLAYVVYTSGSTGRPKGIAVNHITLTNFIGWHLATTSLNDFAKTLQYAPLSFDVSNQEIFATLCAGGTLQLVAEETRLDPAGLWALLQREAIQRLFLPPAAFDLLVHFAESQPKKSNPALREVWVGGEQLKLDEHWKSFFRRNADCRLFNYYGPSECHAVTAFPLPKNVDQWPALPPIGKAFSNIQIYILDPNQNPVPIGVPGEIYIGGPCPARGYLNRDKLTREKFIPDPFSPTPGSRLYRTGDRARFLNDGNIEFMGRFDTQMKIRGFRVEAEEVESHLVEHSQIASAVVTLVEHPPGLKRLAAYLIPAHTELPNSADLRAFLRKTLPDYMLPSAFKAIPSIPLTPNGKVDRKQLPPLSDSDLFQEGAFEAPRSKLEADLEKIWKRLLGLPAININESFFNLGGHSLLAITLKTTIEKELGLQLPIHALFRNPTIAALAALLQQQPKQQTSSVLLALNAGDTGLPLFCVHPVGGHVFCFRELAACLGPKQRFYAFRAKGLEDQRPPLQNVETMAACYVKALQKAHPSGPFVLCGYSMGGQVAFEMARQLHQTQRKPNLLILLDSYPHWDPEQTNVTQLVATELETLFGMAPRLADQNRIDVEYLWHQLQESSTHRDHQSLEDLQHLVDVFQTNMQAMVAYQPREYQGPCTLIATAELEQMMTRDPLQSWQRHLTDQVHIVSVPGDHYSILKKPHLDQLVRTFQQELEFAQTGLPHKG